MKNNGKGKDPRFKDLEGQELYNAILKDFKRQMKSPVITGKRTTVRSWGETVVTNKF